MSSSFRLSFAILLVLFATCPVLTADPVTPMHLVGHEDIELLDRVQDLIDDWDPRKLVNPLFETTDVRMPDGSIERRRVLKRADLGEFIADVEAAEVLGKALFWDMQAGSDFRRIMDKDGKGKFVGTACASCHYRNGADARSRHTMRIPFVAWDKYKLQSDKPLGFGEIQLPYDVKASAVYETLFPKRPNECELPKPSASPFGALSLTVGSAGIAPWIFAGNNGPPPANGPWESEKSSKRTIAGYQMGYLPQWAMFVEGQTDNGRRFRQITPRNSPSVINSGFADRLFHDGRAESTFNGFSIHGDRDERPVLYRGVPERDAKGEIKTDKNGVPIYGEPVQVHVAITKAALASQAVGPILSDVEMSYTGRTFPNVACKLLDAKILPFQSIIDTDSVLGTWKKRGLIGPGEKTMTYRDLIRRAFRREWWDGGIVPQGRKNAGKPFQVPLVLLTEHEVKPQMTDGDIPKGDMMIANFPLYWGLSIMFYESSLVSNQSPFDGMMMGNSTLVEERWSQVKGELGTIRLDRVMVNNVPAPEHKTGSAVFQHGFRLFMNRGCIECHGGPLFSELYERIPEEQKFPIHEQMATTLLPNSRADAIAIKRDEYHQQFLDRVTQLLSTAPVNLPAHQAKRLARTLDTLRERARGNKVQLRRLIQERLTPLGGAALSGTIAQSLMDFEKLAPRKFGNRTFFTEDERVDMVEQLVEPVLVESMPIPPKQVLQRPRLPIQGLLATEPYAFYDTAFYALSVAPARYDSGVGQFVEAELTDSELKARIDQAIAHVERDLDRELSQEDEKPTTPEKTSRTNSLTAQKQSLEPLKGGVTPDKLYEERPKLNPELQSRLNQALDELVAQRPNSATAGQSDRFRSATPYKGLKFSASEERTGKPCDQGPAVDPDANDKRSSHPDNSWDRNSLPENVRRSDLIFFSRARTLVSDEEPWGFRKPFLHDNELAFWGAFKTPSLRNVELTAPYMHNGRLESLEEVIHFYNCGGDFEAHKDNYPDKHPEIVPLNMTMNDQKALRFFLICLTDEHVRREQAPFDHPSLQLVHGYDNQLNERIFDIFAVGQEGWTDPNKIPSKFPHRQ